MRRAAAIKEKIASLESELNRIIRAGSPRRNPRGSDYWSQDSVVQVMGCPETPTQIWIRWPGGKITTCPFPVGAKEITVDTGGI